LPSLIDSQLGYDAEQKIEHRKRGIATTGSAMTESIYKLKAKVVKFRC
jgi:hypothetical protein